MTEKEFITDWSKKLWSESIKKFPDDFIHLNGSKTIELPGKALVIGEQFFGAFEILTVDGNAVYQAANHDEAKFIVYANKDKLKSLPIPSNPDEITFANSSYEIYLDSIIRQIESDYRKKFPKEKNSALAVNEIFRMLNLVRY